jgi:hypothetical protein
VGDNNTDDVRDPANLGVAFRENAYDFVNASLREADAAVIEPKRWKFAIVHVAQALELLLKARLADEHALLVMGNVDKPGRFTVGFDKALDRLATCGVTLQHEDLLRLRAARDLRNDLTHFHAIVSDEELRAAFIDLFEFSHVFHLRELDGELHEHVEEQLWPSEADMMEAFHSDLVTYQGAQMVPQFAAQIVAAQYYREVEINGERYERIACGIPVISSLSTRPRAAAAATAQCVPASYTPPVATPRLAPGAASRSSAVASATGRQSSQTTKVRPSRARFALGCALQDAQDVGDSEICLNDARINLLRRDQPNGYASSAALRCLRVGPATAPLARLVHVSAFRIPRRSRAEARSRPDRAHPPLASRHAP